MISRREHCILNLGCGRKPIDGAVNVDRIAGPKVDVVHDLDRRPWPFTDGEFQEVIAYDVLEHLADLVQAMEELHRISASGAIVRITTPHYSSPNAFTDPTHRKCFGFGSFDYFTGEREIDFYTQVRFRRRHASMIFAPTLANKVVSRLANRFPSEYERRWAWMFPAWFLYFELEVVKEAVSLAESR